MSAIPEQQKLEDNINRNMTSFYQSAGKSNETPKSSFSTDTEVYCINFNTIHAPFYSFDDSISSDNDGYDTERHLRVIRQVSSDTYGSDNCFYSDSEMKIPDVIHQDNTTSNILYEMCDTLNKVPDILSGNVDNSNAQKEKSCRYSGTSSSSFCSDDRSPNWSPNSTPQLKQWPNSESERLGNDMTDTDSIIYHNIEDRHLDDNVVRYSPDFLNSTVDLFNTKPSNFRANPIVHDEINVDQYKQVLNYSENVMPCERQPETPTLKYDRNVSPDKLSKEYINLDILNKLNLNQIDQDIDHEISNLLNTDCLLKSDDKKIDQFKSNKNNNSQFYEYDPSSSNSYCDFSNPVGETKGISKDPRLKFKEDSYRGTDWLRRIVKENKTSYKPETGKEPNENKYPDLAYYQKENNKQYDLSESISAPDIFERNKKHRYSTSSIDEGSDYDPEMRFHKFSKSISNVNIHEYGKKYLRSNLGKNRNSREELRRIEKAVENMLEQVEIQENLLENDMNNMRRSQRKVKDIPFLFDRGDSVSKFSGNLAHVPINCNRNPLKYKYQTKPDLNVMSSSNVSSSCSIEDLERSVNKLLSDVEQEESKLFSSRDLNEYYPRRDVKAVSSEDYEIGKQLPHSKYNETVSLDNTFNDSLKNQDLTFGHMEQSLSRQPQYNIPSSSSNSNSNVFSSNPHIKCNFKTDQDVWWEGAYHGLHEDLGELQRKVKRSNKRATFWPNNPYGFDRQISYTPSSEEGYSSSSNSECEREPSSKKGAISLRVNHLRNGKHGIQIEPVHRTSRNQIEMSNHSLNSLWNRSMPSLPSASSESSVKSALSLQSSGSEDCLSNLGYYQNLVIPSCSIEYITPAELGFSSNLLNSGYCHWNFPDEEESDLQEPTSSKGSRKNQRPSLKYDISMDEEPDYDPREHDWRFDLPIHSEKEESTEGDSKKKSGGESSQK
uniref:Uncharacterized protein n=1 Tax=Cacopsylla melanoneura TaxID=428564 RepID=A0A8D8RN73_9HEMI